MRPAPVLEAEQRAESGGLAVTLDRVEDSPGMPYAVFCTEQPDDDHESYPNREGGGPHLGRAQRRLPPAARAGTKPRGGLHGRAPAERSESYSLVVTKVVGYPKPGTEYDGPEDEKKIEGPWRFYAEVPKP